MSKEWLLDDRWKYRYILKNFTPMCDEGQILWDGEVDLDTAKGDGDPKKWKENESGCYYVHYLTHQYGLRHGRVIGYRIRRDGVVLVTVKEPDHFTIPKGKRIRKKHTKVEVQFNSILWALHHDYEQRRDVPYDNRLHLLLPKDVKQKQQRIRKRREKAQR